MFVYTIVFLAVLCVRRNGWNINLNKIYFSIKKSGWGNCKIGEKLQIEEVAIQIAWQEFLRTSTLPKTSSNSHAL